MSAVVASEFPAASCVEWKLQEKDLEIIDNISQYPFNLTLEPLESMQKRGNTKLDAVPILNWELQNGFIENEDRCRAVAVNLAMKRDEETDKAWIEISHDSTVLGKWHCTEWSVQFKQVIECCEIKAQMMRTWADLVKQAEEQEKNESQTKKSRKKKRKVTPRDTTVYRYSDLKLHPLVLLVDENDNWKVRIQLSAYCTINNVNRFNTETNKLLGDLFLDKDPDYFYQQEYTSNQVKQYFNRMVDKYSQIALKKGVHVETPSSLEVKLLPFQMESVDWMLRKEGFYDEPELKVTTREELNNFLDQYVSYGYIYMPINNCFWNRFTGYILPTASAWTLCEEFLANPMNVKKARGVLAEEMGLGKTIEVLAVMMKNPRDLSKESESFTSPINGKTVKRTKTNLIICPESILQQWLDEISIHINTKTTDFRCFHYEGFNKMSAKNPTATSPTDLASQLAEYDVVICSYGTLSAEVHYAEFSANQRPSRDSTRRFDYTSPLTILEFHRLVLDEVQLFGSANSGTRCAKMLHRFHTWGVSGTPVQWYSDIRVILSYLQFDPFVSYYDLVNHVMWRNFFHRTRYHENPAIYLSGFYENLLPDEEWNGYHGCKCSPEDILEVFSRFNLIIRHKKEDVQDQIKIPAQLNYMIPVEFNPIEQDYYSNLWEAFLAVSGYDSRGNGTCNLDPHELTTWISRLRAVCCHVSMSDGYIPNHQRYTAWRETDELKDMDAILDTMKNEVRGRIQGLQRENFSIETQLGQVRLELEEDFESAINIFAKVIEGINHDLKTVYGIDTYSSLDDKTSRKDQRGDSKESVSNVRVLLHTLHQAYFFLATTYYHLGSKRLEEIDAAHEAEDNGVSKKKKKNMQAKDLTKKSCTNDKLYEEVLSSEELQAIKGYQQLEEQNYAVAEQLRQEMLYERITDISTEIDRVRDWFMNKNTNKQDTLDEIAIEKRKFGKLVKNTQVFGGIVTLFTTMNQQRKQFNLLLKDLEVLCYNKIKTNHELESEEEKSKEYEKSIDEQDKIFSILDALEQILENREDLVSGESAVSLPASAMEGGSPFHKELLEGIVFGEGDTLKMLLNEAEVDKSLKHRLGNNNVANHSVQDFVNCYEMEIVRVIKENQQLRILLKKFNDIYNSKTSYYSYLQRISDSLLPLSTHNKATRTQIVKRVTSGEEFEKNRKTIGNLQSRVRYLDTLSQLKSAIAQGEHITCPISYAEIYTGSILKCGHYFSKDSIMQWFRKNQSCPLCKMQMSSSDIYHFKFREAEPLEDVTGDSTATSTKSAENAKIKEEASDDENSAEAGRDDETRNADRDRLMANKYKFYPQIEDVNKVQLQNTWGGKIDQVVRLILYIKEQHLLTQPHKRSPQFVIYSSHWTFLDLLSKLLSMHGVRSAKSLRSTKFAKAVNTFRKDPECTCLLLNVHSQATGLTLINAKHLILLDPIFEESTEAQAISRVHRIGQTSETHVWNFMVRNTVEESITKYKAVLEGERKRRIAEREQNERTDADEEEDDVALDTFFPESSNMGHYWHCLFENFL